MRELNHMSDEAARCVLSRGQVALEGEPLGMQHQRMSKRELKGRLLRIVHREFRLFGSRLDGPHERLNEQLELGG